MNKNQLKSFIKENEADLKNRANAMVAEKAIQVLTNKGFVFETKHDLNMFFKERIKSRVDGDKTTLMVDGVEILVYGKPKYAALKNNEVSIGFDFLEI